jgi:hypothetical protein
MNRIILAYAPQNELLAKELDQKLSPVGIPFDHINGTLQNLPETGVDPVMLLVPDERSYYGWVAIGDSILTSTKATLDHPGRYY